MLTHLLNGLSPDPVGDYVAINQELARLSPELAPKPQIVALNKMDLTEVRRAWPGIATHCGRWVWTSRWRSQPSPARTFTRAAAAHSRRFLPQPLLFPAPSRRRRSRKYLVLAEDMSFTISRVRPTAAGGCAAGAHRTHYGQLTGGNTTTVLRFQRILGALGITAALRARGVQEGDPVRMAMPRVGVERNPVCAPCVSPLRAPASWAAPSTPSTSATSFWPRKPAIHPARSVHCVRLAR